MADFYLALATHGEVYLLILALVMWGFGLLFHKHIYSIFDPLFYFVVVTEAFCFADVLFMGIYEIIEPKYVVQYTLTEFAMFFGILIFKIRIPKRNIEFGKEETESLVFLFGLSFFLFVVLNLVVYAIAGIPLLMENRLEIYRIGGGIGIISRALDVLLIIVVYYLLELYRQKGWGPREWACLLTVMVFQVLSGAKSAVLTVVFITSLHAYCSGMTGAGMRGIDRLLTRLFVFAVVGLFITAQVQIADIEIGGKSLNLLDQVMLRMVNNGDAFMYAYPDAVVEQLEGSRPFVALFREYIAFFRLAPPEDLPLHIGSQLVKFFQGEESNFQTNAKHNLFGYIHFGLIGAIFYSFALGAMISIVRYKLLQFRNKSSMFGILYILLNLGFITAIHDFDNSARSILNVIFIFIPLFLVMQAIRLGVRTRSRANLMENPSAGC
jgi:hypothetical protein